MPRDLTDLMESATAFAPPEPHGAADITRLAARRQRRGTTGIAGAAALAVVVAGVAGYGVTRGQKDTAPEPAKHFKLNQTVDLSQVVPADSLPGYALQPWTIPSVQDFPDNSRIPTYQAVDSSGRLLVVDAPGGTQVQGPFRMRLFDAPGEAAQPLQTPASPGTVGSVQITWLAQFYGADQLLWHPSTGSRDVPYGFHVTDLQGGHDQFVPATFQVGKTKLQASSDDVSGRSMWMTVPAGNPTRSGLTVSDVYRGTFSGHATKMGTGVTMLDVGSGIAGWVTTRGQVFVQSATGAPPQQVRVPLDRGCRVFQSTGAFAVAGSTVALTEQCGSGVKATQRLLAFDLSGRPLVRVAGATPFNLAIAGDSLLFQANELVLRYDLVTGTLSQLGQPGSEGTLTGPSGAGRYVLWYDGKGGHVAEFSD